MPLASRRSRLRPTEGLHPGATPEPPGVQKSLILRGVLEAGLLWRRGRDCRASDRNSIKSVISCKPDGVVCTSPVSRSRRGLLDPPFQEHVDLGAPMGRCYIQKPLPTYEPTIRLPTRSPLPCLSGLPFCALRRIGSNRSARVGSDAGSRR